MVAYETLQQNWFNSVTRKNHFYHEFWRDADKSEKKTEIAIIREMARRTISKNIQSVPDEAPIFRE